jgi:hypothetical protein
MVGMEMKQNLSKTIPIIDLSSMHHLVIFVILSCLFTGLE